MIAVALLAAAAPHAMTVIDAERAFAEDAQRLGQWTAFRKWAAPDAVMFVPEPTKAQAWLKDRKDPAKSVEWWPTKSLQSCDGSLAVNTGGWRRPDGSVGYFTTVWGRTAAGGWQWLMDSGDTLRRPRSRPKRPSIVRPHCGGRAEIDMGGQIHVEGKNEFYASRDQTVDASWSLDRDGLRQFFAAAWQGGRPGRRFKVVIADTIAPTKP